MPLPKQFDGPQQALLRAALLDAFPHPAGFGTFLSDHLNKVFAQLVAAADTYENQLVTLLTEANSKVWIADLVMAAVQAVPANPKLQQFAKAHGFERSEPGSEGFLVPKLYDRVYQVGDFAERFQAAIQAPPLVQKYLVFGEEYEAHRSLFQRLVDERVRPAAVGRWGEADGTVRAVEVLEWPQGSDQRVLRKRVSQALYEATGSQAPSPKGAYDILSASSCFCEHKVLVVGQQIVLDDWGQASADLLRWYLEEFWRMALGPNDPAIVLFVQVECKEQMSGAVVGGKSPKEEVLASLEGLTQLTEAGPPVLLDELLELREIDVRNWFVRFLADRAGSTLNVADEAKAVRDRAKTRRNGIRRTDDIERLLGEVYDKWIERAGVGE